jgi:hypothetical protein
LKTNLTTARRLQSGIALIMVMIIILTLSAVVGGFAYAMKVEMRLARNSDYENDMVWLGRSGVELARYVITLRCGGQQGVDALNQPWAGGTATCNDTLAQVPLHDIELVPGRIKDIKITDLSRKFDINTIVNPAIPQNIEVLRNVLTQMGVTDSGLSQTIMDSVQDWVGPRDAHARLSGAKDDYYLGQYPPYYCKCGWFDDINELLLVKGIKDHPEIFWGSNSSEHHTSAYELKAQNSPFLRDREQPNYPFGLNDVFAVGGQKLNVNTAPVSTIQLIPGIYPEMAEQAQHNRAGPDGADGNEDDAPFNNPGEAFTRGVGGQAPIPNTVLGNYLDTHSMAFEVKVSCEIGGYAKEYTAILVRPAAKPQDLQVVRFWWK